MEKLLLPLPVAQSHILSSLSNLAREIEFGPAVVAAGALPPLLELLRGGAEDREESLDNNSLCIAAATFVNHIVRQDNLRASVVSAGAIPILMTMAQGDDPTLVAKARELVDCFLISLFELLVTFALTT